MKIADIELTSPDRVVYDSSGVTKQELAEYYAAVAPWMLPHAARRPISMVRCPAGQSKECFYQKHWSHTVPTGLDTVDVEESDGDVGQYVQVVNASGLVALVQYGVLEVHLWGTRVDKLESPDRIVFDLDPAPDVQWDRVVDTARNVRALLVECGLTAWVKTTGGKGLHVVVPIQRTVTWDDVHDFVRLTTAALMARYPRDLIDVASKAKRTGRIFIDYLRNNRGATAIAPWSTRAREGAPVAMPIAWEELDTITGGDVFDIAEALTRAAKLKKDPWASMLTSRQRLTQKTMEHLIR